VLVDPPYTMTDHDTLARYLPHVLADDGVLVFETDARIEPQLPLEIRKSRVYGGTRVTLFEHR
jgi:16S rRNA G966 N2-methylase RsmD